MDGEDATATAGAASGGGSGGTSAATGGSSTGGRRGRATGGTGGRGGRATGGVGGGDIRDCLTCAMGFCSTEFTDCLTSTACTDGLWCAVTTCTDSTDAVCLLGCFEDPAGALEALALVSCVTDNCGADCLAGLAL